MPSKLQATPKRHKMPFSPCSQKANNVKIVVQVSVSVTIDLIKCKLYHTHKCQIYKKRPEFSKPFDLSSFTV